MSARDVYRRYLLCSGCVRIAYGQVVWRGKEKSGDTGVTDARVHSSHKGDSHLDMIKREAVCAPAGRESKGKTE